MKLITGCSSVSVSISRERLSGYRDVSSEPLIVKICGFKYLEGPTLADVSL